MNINYKSTVKPITVLLAFLIGGTSGVAFAQDDGVDPYLTNPDEFELRAVTKFDHTDALAYWHSSAASNTGVAISIKNLGNKRCITKVTWYAGGGQKEVTTALDVLKGQTLEHCSRSGLPQPVTCNATAPAFQFIEGSAYIKVKNCEAYSIDAKQYYESAVNGITVTHRQ